MVRRIGELRKIAAERRDGIEAIGFGNPADTPRGNAGEAPANVVPAAQFPLFGDQQAQEGTSYMTEADDGKIVRGNRRSP